MYGCFPAYREHFGRIRKSGGGFQVPSHVPPPGSFIAAQFTYDNNWYRAKVMDVVHPTPHGVCVCLCVCVCTCVCVCVGICVFVLVCVGIYMCVFVCTYIIMCIYLYVCI